MSFLPLIERELSAAARTPSNYRVRTVFALITSLLAAGILLLEIPLPGRRVGHSLFSGLSVLAFLYCLLAGARQAADVLSEEKREGTLGFLFLTDLRVWEVLAAKFISVSARSFQGLFAFFPVLSVGLVLGGLTAGEFWRETALLTNTLFFAVSVGLFVSALSREAHRALFATLVLLSLTTIVPALAHTICARFWPTSPLRWATCLSPATASRYAPDLAYQSDPGIFWGALLVSHLAGWGFLCLAGVILPHAWQDRPLFGRTRWTPAIAPHTSKGASERLQERRRLLDHNPILWLVLRKRRQRWLLHGFTAVIGLACLAVLPLNHAFGGRTFGIPSLLNFGLGLVLKVWVAWQACSTLAEAKRTGAIELLLATPLQVDDIIRGHWRAMLRLFRWPAIAALLLILLPALDALLREHPSRVNLFLVPVPTLTLFSMATFVFDLMALTWVGMWMGLSQKRSIQAFAKTVLFVIVIPQVIFCLPNLVFDLFWMGWARRQLEYGFRKSAANQYASADLARLPAPPRYAANPIPPLIPGG